MIYYELSSLNDTVYQLDPDWLSSMKESQVCKVCGNTLDDAKYQDAMPVSLKSESFLGQMILPITYRVAVNVIHKKLYNAISSDLSLFYRSAVTFIGSNNNDYYSIIVPDQFRIKKNVASWSEISHCEQCGRQLGGPTSWVFQKCDPVCEIISNDYGSGLFVSNSVLNKIAPCILDQISLHPRKMTS